MSGETRHSLHGIAIGVAIILGGIFLSLGMAGSVVAARYANPSGPNQPVHRAQDIVQGPVLESSPYQALGELLSEKRERLNGYGWIDRATGRVHIPIALAVRLLEERGVKPGAEQP